jgi:hypothetical protein
VTRYRVWALVHYIDDRPVWLPISQVFHAKVAASSWAGHLNTEYKIEAEEVD